MRKSGFTKCSTIDYQGPRRSLVWGDFDAFFPQNQFDEKGGDIGSKRQKWTKLQDEF